MSVTATEYTDIAALRCLRVSRLEPLSNTTMGDVNSSCNCISLSVSFEAAMPLMEKLEAVMPVCRSRESCEVAIRISGKFEAVLPIKVMLEAVMPLM